MLYAILFTACLIGTTDCKTVELRQWDLPVLPVAQFKAAEMIAAEWVSKHPARQIKGGVKIQRVKLDGEQAI